MNYQVQSLLEDIKANKDISFLLGNKKVTFTKPILKLKKEYGVLVQTKFKNVLTIKWDWLSRRL